MVIIIFKIYFSTILYFYVTEISFVDKAMFYGLLFTGCRSFDPSDKKKTGFLSSCRYFCVVAPPEFKQNT